jgi:hypothetical protein
MWSASSQMCSSRNSFSSDPYRKPMVFNVALRQTWDLRFSEREDSCCGLWLVAPCILVDGYQCSGRTYFPSLQEYRSTMFLRNFGIHQPDCTMSQHCELHQVLSNRVINFSVRTFAHISFERFRKITNYYFKWKFKALRSYFEPI